MGKSWLLIGCSIFLIIAALIAIVGLQPIGGNQQDKSTYWMFEGAYAAYEGHIASVTSPYSVNETIEVIGLNVTHVEVKTNSTIATPTSPTLTDQTVQWINRSNILFQPKGEPLARTYETQIITRNGKAYDCIVYDYINDMINVTYYMDKSYLWPVRVVYVVAFENQTYPIEFNLVDTNISGLN